ncbi:protein far1-related sequence 5 [Phtheirospermum japonicum]|uniref:Protein far1-related sequence 5 n=1 Tax=Phtheirospermum japonicum TaxID=374723 RepID=A0A830CVG9_9LAMI|nr:protein far1-related sequence 5 [Phtheirospermum japonicum]
MMFDSLDNAFEFWKSYGGKVGFGVRKEYNNRNKNGTIIGKMFVCYKQVFKKQGEVCTNEFHRRADVKCGCKCKLKVVLDRESGKYVVSKFVEDHNHDLQPPQTAHMLRSQREITMTQALAIEQACDSGLTPRITQELMSREAGGRANLGFVIEDQKTYLRSQRNRDMARGELGSVLAYFQK